MGAVIDDFFLCIGAQKSGTTWLARVLAPHPQLFLTPVKEIHYFDHIAGITEHLGSKKRRSRYRKYHQRMWTQWGQFGAHWGERGWYRDYMSSPIDDVWYARLFAERAGKQFAGEVTPEYALIGEDGFRHVLRLAPKARVLFVMRNPVTQTWSQVLHYARANDIDTSRLATDDLIALTELPRIRALRDYDLTLSAVSKAVPADQLMTMFYEDIHADRGKALADVCRFIGISFRSQDFPELSQRYNSSQDAALPDATRDHLRTTCEPIIAAIEKRLGRVPESWHAA